MNKIKILELIITLAGFEPRMVEMERIDGYCQYSGEGIEIVDGEDLPVLSFHGENFEVALGNLLAQIYDTSDIDFQSNAAIKFGK